MNFFEETVTQAINETQLKELEETPGQANYFHLLAAFLLILAAGIIYWTRFRKTGEKKRQMETTKPVKEETTEKTLKLHQEEKDILEFVQKSGGSTTQKELRKALPYSESKVSMVLTNLEAMGKLKKNKRGRGNVIRLN